MAKNWFSGGSSDGQSDDGWFTGGSSGSGTNKLRKRLKDEADARQEALLNAEALTKETAVAEDQRKAAANSKKSILTRGKDIVKGVGNFGVGVVKDVKDTTVGTWQGAGDVVRGELGSNEMESKTRIANERNKEWSKRFGSASEDKWKDPKFIAEAKKFTEETKRLTAVSDRSREDIATSQKVDAKKLAFQAGETVLNVGTLGLGTVPKSVAKTGVKTAVKQAVKTGGVDVLKELTEVTAKNIARKEALRLGGSATAKKIATNVTEGALLGGGYGVTQTGKNNPDASLEEYARNVALGLGIGAALPVGGAGLKKLKQTSPVKAADKFVADLATKATQKLVKSKLGVKVGNITEKVQTALGESLAPVMRDFKGLKDPKSGRQINEEIRLLDGNVSNSASITAGRLKENPAFNALAQLVEPKDTKPGSLRAARKEAKELGTFISQKQDAINRRKLGETVEIPTGTPKQEKAYELLNKSTKDDIQYAYDNDLISDANYQKYMADDNYTRVQRDLSEEVQSNFKGVGGPAGSISKANTFSQRLKGSDKEAIDPFVAHFDWSNKITHEVQRQKLSNYIIQQREANGLGKGFLRKAENVEARQAAAAEAAQLRVLRNGLDKVVKSESRYGRRIQQELDALNKKGLDVSLKKGGKEALPEFSPEGLGGKVPTSRAGTKVGPRDTKQFVKNLVDAPVSDLEAIKRKIANREPKLAQQIDNIIYLKQEHEIASKAVRDLVETARSNADKITTNKTTIKTLKRGIKEVYEDDPRIVDAINKVGRVELHTLLKIAQAPSKLVQRTATAMNFVFTASNLVKDQVGSAVLSKNVMNTHNPITFMTALREAALKPTGKALLRGVGARKTAERVLNPSKEYEKFLKYVAGSTRTDINRNLQSTARRTYEALGLKHDNVVRKVENINSATENLTRFQNYVGQFKKGLKDGLDIETAQANAIQAARENSVDFSRSGDWAPFLKIFNPFANANIQGSRSLIRAARERPVSTALKLGTTIMAPVAAATYWNLGDPERALIYSALPESDKANNLIFVMSDGNVLKLPMAPGIKEIGAPVRGMIEAEYGVGDPQDFIETAKSIFADSINPFNASDIVPQFSKPIIEAQTNHSFFTGDSIVPEYLQKKDTGDQVFKTTSQTYRDIGKRFGISPLIAKQIITGYGSSVAEQSVSLFDQLRKAGGATNEKGEPITTDKRNTAQQLQGKFYKDSPDLQIKANSEFYDRYDPIRTKRDTISREVTSLVKAGRTNEARRKAGEFNETLPGKFSGIKQYGWDDNWDELLNSLQIKVSEKAFASRLKQ